MKTILNNVELTKLSVLKEELELLNEEIEELEIRLNHFENEDEDGSEMEEISFLEETISKAEVAKDNLESEINSIIKPNEEVYESKSKLEERIISYLLIQILKTISL